MADKLKPCPFCGRKLIHIRGKRIDRFYKGEPTLYEHEQTSDCVLGKYGKECQVWNAEDVELWNRRVNDG